jgi:Cu/Ag efflux protein CusF
MVETYTTTASVQAIDAATREVTMVTSEGKTSKITASPKVKNFNQIQIGDQVTATVTKTVDVSLLEPGETRSPGQSSVSGSASEGTKPGAMTSQTVQATARIEALDAKHRKVTLRFSDGSAENFDVRKDIDMSKAHLGQQVLIRSTEEVAVRVEKP